MRRRRLTPLLTALCVALMVACAGLPSRAGSSATPAPTPPLLSGSGPEDETSRGAGGAALGGANGAGTDASRAGSGAGANGAATGASRAGSGAAAGGPGSPLGGGTGGPGAPQGGGGTGGPGAPPGGGGTGVPGATDTIGSSSTSGSSAAGPASARVPGAPTPTVTARQSNDPTAVVVFASSPFGRAFSELGSDFMLAAPQATGVSYRFDNSAQLRNLIQTGADADVFVSIDPAQMDSLNQGNLLASPPSVLVKDRLVVVVSNANPQGLKDFKALADPGVRFIIPAPTSTTTTAIMAAFNKASSDPAYGADFGAKADRNVLARDGDDRLVLDRIAAGEVSAGIVYASSIDPGSAAKVQEVAIPDSVSGVANYPIAVLKNATNPQGGQAFVRYALSAQAQDVLARYGFSKVDAAP